MTLFDPGPGVAQPEPGEKLSADARRTLANNTALAAGRHPATRRKLLPLAQGKTCGGCVHHHAYGWHNKTFHKCDLHRLGESHSAASDVRVGWPACELWDAS